MTNGYRNGMEEILRGARLLFRPGDVVEIRIPNAGPSGTVSGYFDDLEILAKAAAAIDGKAAGVYWTLHRVNPALLARASNRLQHRARVTTQDANIIALRWFYVDLDPVRPAGISSTDAEHHAALALAAEIRAYLVGLGWAEPIVADSGNGPISCTGWPTSTRTHRETSSRAA